MDAHQPDGSPDLQKQVDDLRSRADASDRRASASEARADEAELRVEDIADRAEAARSRTDVLDRRSADDRRRIAGLEERLDVHQEMLAELQADGLVSAHHAAHLEIALQAARTIGAAIGIVIARYRVREEEAFALLKKTSQDSNRKLRLVADDVLLAGDIDRSPARRAGRGDAG